MRSELGGARGARHARQDQHLLSLVVVRMYAAPAFSRISFTLPRRQKTKQQSVSLFVVTEFWWNRSFFCKPGKQGGAGSYGRRTKKAGAVN